MQKNGIWKLAIFGYFIDFISTLILQIAVQLLDGVQLPSTFTDFKRVRPFDQCLWC